MNKHTPAHRRHFLCLLALLGVTLYAQMVLSHSRMISPAGRTSTDPGTQGILDNAGLNFDDPCGPQADIPPGAPSATWEAGSDQLVDIDHRVHHGGETYQLFISFDGAQTFDEVLAPNQSQGGADSYQPGGIATTGSSSPTLLIGLPTTIGEAVLRYTDGVYFNCADIVLTGGGTEVFSDGFELGDVSAWTQ